MTRIVYNIRRGGDYMGGKTSWQVKNRYNAKTYDVFAVRLRKDSGTLDRFRAAAELAGQSLTAYIVQAVEERMQREHANK